MTRRARLASPVRRIALVGAECTGKSTLAARLAQALPGVLVGEYLREFCDREQRTPRRDEQATIAATQRAREDAALAVAAARGLSWVVCDTTPLMTAIYGEFVFGDASLLAPAIARQRAYALTLVTLPEFDWQADGLQRDGEQARRAVDRRLHELLATHEVPHVRVGGDPARRLAQALALAADLAGAD